MKNDKKIYKVDTYGKSSNGMINHQTRTISGFSTKSDAKKAAESRCQKQFGLQKSKTKVR